MLLAFGGGVVGFPGRDFFFMMASRYVPTDWAVLYDIFRISSLYGQNCDLYVCQPKRGEQQPLVNNNSKS